MSTTRFLIDGSEKIIGHYRFLLDTAKTEQERKEFTERINEEKRNLERLLADSAQPAQAA